MLEQLGARLQRLRAALEWTQQELAERIAVSRVAVSHFEMGLQVPSERTIVLLAGVFGCEPHELVAGTSYPPAKTDRLPLVAARYTVLDHTLALIDHDLQWIARLPAAPRCRSLAHETLHGWLDQLALLHESWRDRRSRHAIEAARVRVQHALHEFNQERNPSRP